MQPASKRSSSRLKILFVAERIVIQSSIVSLDYCPELIGIQPEIASFQITFASLVIIPEKAAETNQNPDLTAAFSSP
jgi:hypothetical protein